MPLGAKSKYIVIWNSVIEKCEKKLARWKGQYLSFGGRLTLINSVLDAMPACMMSLFPIPAGVIDRLDRIRRKFLWQGNKDRKGYNLVMWKDLLIEKRFGGLGIKNLQNHSKALRMKWLWKYANDKQLLWGKVVKAKYERENRWMTKEVISPYGVNLWRSVRALWDDFKIKTKVKVKNGEKTSFWEDDWHELGVLRNIYPDIYNLMLNQQRTISEMWEISFRRQVNDWEITRVAEFFNTIGQFKGALEGEDELWWQGNDRGIFKVGKAYRWLNNHNHQTVSWPWKIIWKVNISYKVACFIWLLSKEVVLTQDNLMKKGITLCPRCAFCGEQAETVRYLFLHCKITGQLWRLFINIKGLSWSMPGKVTEALQSWEEAGIQARSGSRWRIIPASMWWTIWKERNARRNPDHGVDVILYVAACIENQDPLMQSLGLQSLGHLCEADAIGKPTL